MATTPPLAIPLLLQQDVEHDAKSIAGGEASSAPGQLESSTDQTADVDVDDDDGASNHENGTLVDSREKLRRDKRGTMELYQGLGMGVTRMLKESGRSNNNTIQPTSPLGAKSAVISPKSSGESVNTRASAPNSPKTPGSKAPSPRTGFNIRIEESSPRSSDSNLAKIAYNPKMGLNQAVVDGPVVDIIGYDRGRSASADHLNFGTVGKNQHKKKKRLSGSDRATRPKGTGSAEQSPSNLLAVPKNGGGMALSAPASPLSPRGGWLMKSADGEDDRAFDDSSATKAMPSNGGSKRSPRKRSRTIAAGKQVPARPSAKDVLGSLPSPTHKDSNKVSGSVIGGGSKRGDVGGKDDGSRVSSGRTKVLLSKGSMIWGRSGKTEDKVNNKKSAKLGRTNAHEGIDDVGSEDELANLKYGPETEEERRQIKREIMQRRRSRSYSDLTVLWGKMGDQIMETVEEEDEDMPRDDLEKHPKPKSLTSSRDPHKKTDKHRKKRKPPLGFTKIAGTQITDVQVKLPSAKLYRRSNSFADLELILSHEECLQMGLTKHKPTTRPGQVFNVTLEDIMELQDVKDDVPYILVALTEAILMLGGTMTEGLFRVSGNKTCMDELKEQLNAGNYKIPSTTNPHVVSSLLKEWLSTLKEPVFPQDLYVECLNSVSKPRDCLGLIEKMPSVNQRVLKYMVTWLQENILKPEVQRLTRMDISSVAMAFSPCFLKNPAGAMIEEEGASDPLEGTTPPKVRSEQAKEDLQAYVKNMQSQIKFVVNVMMLLNTGGESSTASDNTPRRLMMIAGPAVARVAQSESATRRKSGHFHAWFKRGHDDDGSKKTKVGPECDPGADSLSTSSTNLAGVNADAEVGGGSDRPSRIRRRGSQGRTSGGLEDGEIAVDKRKLNPSSGSADHYTSDSEGTADINKSKRRPSGSWVTRKDNKVKDKSDKSEGEGGKVKKKEKKDKAKKDLAL
eukprot:TRINITY_DN4155_c0_g1_i1.p1 TRINITY_DN4155_c0_g1~~TRINITY_DN4155_c0_g1_i1.p1  ORF type:complete len:959 (-),score=171.35 TRINITY_DN4155_c0_g1_i1:66-2942(-)